MLHRELTKDVPRNPDDCNAAMLPFFHTFGISAVFDNYIRGLRFILIPRFTFTNMLQAIQDFKVTIICSIKHK